MTHEVIEIEQKDASSVHVLAGTVTDIDTENKKAEVDIDEYATVSDIPIFYHCPESETADGMPFSIDDRVIIVNSGNAENLSVADMKVVGFEDGLPRKCCFPDPFTEEDFIWTPSKIKSGDAQLNYISGPTGPLNFATAFDKPSGAPIPAIFRGGGIASYKIESIDLPSCRYFIFKLDAVNIVKDLIGWSKDSKGILYITVGGVSKSVAIQVGALPGLYYSEFFYHEGQERVIEAVSITGNFYTECLDTATVHHEVNMTFDYIKMSNEIPEGGTEVWSQIPI